MRICRFYYGPYTRGEFTDKPGDTGPVLAFLGPMNNYVLQLDDGETFKEERDNW